MNKLFHLAELTCFDNEGDAGDDAVAAAAVAAEAAAKAAEEAAAAEAAAKTSKGDEKKFNQQQVNEMVGKRNKVLQDKFVALEGTYTQLLEQTNLSKGVREQLEADLEAVQAEMRTKEQQIEFDKKKASEKFQTDLDASNEDRQKWQSLYEQSTIERAITDAAISNDGFNGNDFIAHLGPRSKVVDELDSEGVKTGRLVPRVSWEVSNPDTQEVTVVLKSPEEVVKLMKETHGNLFKSNVAKGVGEGTAAGKTPTTGVIDHSKISTEEYMALSKTDEGRARLGLPPMRM